MFKFGRISNNAAWKGFLYPISKNRDPYNVWGRKEAAFFTFMKDWKRKEKGISTEYVNYFI